MEPGEKCIAQPGEWVNAYGDKTYTVSGGMRLTVSKCIYIGGTRFYAFEETPDGNYYMYDGFKPLRSLN